MSWLGTPPTLDAVFGLRPELYEAWRAFRARVRMMVEEYAFPAYQNNPYGEIVDRSIYPEATAEPFTLRWPEAAGDPGQQR